MYDIIIIGGGPAGLTAAIYARRAEKSVLVIEKETFGGQITYSPMVENYPGIKQMTGNEFAESLMEQALNLGVEIEVDTVKEIVCGKVKKVIAEYGEFEAKSVITAVGVKHRKLGVDREDELVGRGVSYCAVCDGAFYKDKDVAVVGGGNTALADAMILAEGCSKVYLIHRRDEFRGEEKTVSKLRQNPKIEFVLNSRVKELIASDELEGIITENKISGETRKINLSGIFVAVGNVPSNEFLSDIINLDGTGYVVSDEKCRTNVEGIFVAGDCRTKEVRQLTTATADGAVAALAACEYISNAEWD